MYRKCQICVNCGRCDEKNTPGKSPNVVVKSILQKGWEETVKNPGRRLVTVDIGTTTIAMQLFGIDGKCIDSYVTINPQTQYGADVISRITAAKEKHKAAHMKILVHSVLQKGIDRFRAILDASEQLTIVLAGNTTMIYLLMGWDPTPLGMAPFEATHLEAFCTKLTDQEIPCYVFPGLSAFIGGDIVAGMQAAGFGETEKVTLFVDLGTNGEIVLGNKDRAVACATAAGPAFEGGAGRGVFGADMVRFTAKLLEQSVIDPTGWMSDRYQRTGIRIGDVCITQQSVRALQCAKAAIFAGIQILMEKYQISEEGIERVVLAGGFGYYLDPQSAARIGLLPKKLAKRTIAGGNTALAGAYQIGRRVIENEVSESEWQTMIHLPSTSVYNLAKENNFQEVYVNAMELVESALSN